MGQKLFAGLREADAASRPVQQWHADPSLQGSYGLTHSGRRDAQMAGCSTESAQLRDCQEDDQTVQVRAIHW